MERASDAQENVIRARLKEYDGLLDIKWYPTIRRYALVAQWPSDDARREMFRSGEIDDDCDILGWYAIDVQDADTAGVSLDTMEGKIQSILAKTDNTKTPWKLRLAQIVENNIQRRKKLRAPILDRAEQIAKDLEYMIGHNEEVKMERIIKEAATQYQEG